MEEHYDLKTFQIINWISRPIIDFQLRHVEMPRQWFLHNVGSKGWIGGETDSLVFVWGRTSQCFNALVQLLELTVYLCISCNMNLGEPSGHRAGINPSFEQGKADHLFPYLGPSFAL